MAQPRRNAGTPASAPHDAPTAPGHPQPPHRPRTGTAPLRGRIANRLTVTLVALLAVLAAVMAYGATHSRQTTTRIPVGTPAGSPTPGTTASQAPDAVTPAELAALADTRSKALADGDENAFLAALDPATPGLVDEQRRLFRNLRPIPFDEAAYRIAATRPGPGPGDPLTVDVSFDHRITHADTSTVGEGYRWTVTRPAPGAAPRITSITGTPYEGGAGYRYARDYPAPWDRAQLTVARRPHIVVLAEQALADRAEPLADAAEQAAAADLAAYAGPRGTAPGFVVVPVADRAAFYELYGGRADQHGDESGLTYALRSSPTGNTAATARPGTTAQFGGARIVLDVTSGYFTGGDATRTGDLLRHEMAHALVTPLRSDLAGQNQPVWVVEGFADWLAFRSDRDRLPAQFGEARTYLRTGRFTGTLPTDTDLYQADPVGNAASYQLAHLAMLRIEETRGAAAVFRFAAAVYAAPSTAAVDRALHDATGLDRAAFEADWAQYARALLDHG